MFLAAVLAALCAAPARGTAAAEGLRVRLALLPFSAGAGQVAVRVVNVDSQSVDVTRVVPATRRVHNEPGRHEHRPEEDGDPRIAPLRPAEFETRPGRLSFVDPPRLPWRGLKPAEGRETRLRLSPPRKPGAYKEVVQVDWQYPPASGKLASRRRIEQAELFYRVAADGGVHPISEDAYHRAIDDSHVVRLAGDDPRSPLREVLGSAIVPRFRAGDDVPAITISEVPPGDPGPLDDDEPQADGEVLTLEYCVRIVYLDDFASCPIDSATTGMKWWQPYCDPTQEVPHLGLEVTLHDFDSSSSDDYIGTYALHYNGLRDYSCIEFQWDQRHRGENRPDVYLRTNFDVHDTEFGAAEQIHLCIENQKRQEECDANYFYSWRESYVPNLGPSATVYASYDFGPADEVWNKRAMGMASVQKFLRTFKGDRMTGDMNVWWNGDQCTQDGDPWPCSYDDNWFTLTSGLYQRWNTGPHEAGHSYQKQLFEQGRLTGKNCPSPHSRDTRSNEACATREGWAHFVAVVSWWPEEAARTSGAPDYRGEDIEFGYEWQDCVASGETEIQVTRTLWDLYDRRADGNDTADVAQSLANVLRAWDAFDDGTANRKDREGGANGCNLVDYRANGAFSADFQTDTDRAMEQNRTRCHHAG